MFMKSVVEHHNEFKWDCSGALLLTLNSSSRWTWCFFIGFEYGIDDWQSKLSDFNPVLHSI